MLRLLLLLLFSLFFPFLLFFLFFPFLQDMGRQAQSCAFHPPRQNKRYNFCEQLDKNSFL